MSESTIIFLCTDGIVRFIINSISVFDGKDLIYVRIDKRRKLLASSLLLALDNKKSSKYREDCLKKGVDIDYTKINGLTHEELFGIFYENTQLTKKNNGITVIGPANVKIKDNCIEFMPKSKLPESYTK